MNRPQALRVHNRNSEAADDGQTDGQVREVRLRRSRDHVEERAPDQRTGGERDQGQQEKQYRYRFHRAFLAGYGPWLPIMLTFAA